jgi:hypothetical protein
MSELSKVYSNHGRFDLAEPILLNCLEYSQNTPGGETNTMTINLMSNLAKLYNNQG